MSLVILALPLSCVTERLAGIAASQDVNSWHCRPVNAADVSEVRYARMVRGHDLAGCGLNLGVPGERSADRHIQAAVA
jgi:hypothetical protein